MSGVNKVIIIGRLGKDPEMRYTSEGVAIANFSVATSEEWKDKNTGEKREKVEWHRIVVYRKLAELCGEYLSKGRQVYIEGKIQTREWEDKDRNKRFTTEIVATDIQFIGNRDNAPGGESRKPSPSENDPGLRYGGGSRGGYGGGQGGAPRNDPPAPPEDDIPF
jgi:single-strand DNA-binding protein